MAAIAAVSTTVAPAAAVATTSRVAGGRPSSVSMAKAFGLKSRSAGRVTCMAATYKVTFLDEAGDVKMTFDCPDSEYVLDQGETYAEEEGLDIELPYSCRAGSCSSCAGKVVEGKVDDEGDFLDDGQKSAGFILTCTSKPLSDVSIIIHMEDALN